MANPKELQRFLLFPINWLEKIRHVEDVELSISTPIGGVSGKITPGKPIRPTRVGIDPADTDSAFVENGFSPLYDCYYGYKNSKPYHSWVSYTDINLLNRDGAGFKSGINTNEISVMVQAEAYDLPSRLEKHQSAAVNLFRDLGKIRRKRKGFSGYHNDTSAKIREFNPNEKQIFIQPATYYDQIATNLTIDWASGCLDNHQLSTIRKDVEPPIEGKLPSLEKSILANTLGVATFVVTSDEKILIPIRGKSVAIMHKGQFHCSASGVFNLDIQADNKKTDFSIFENGMREEIRSELNIDPDCYELIPLAFGRELARGGKPQLFFCTKCKLSVKELHTCTGQAEESWEFTQPEDLSADSPLKAWALNPSLIPSDLDSISKLFTYEGWMGLRLTKSFLEKRAAFQ